MRIGKSLLAGLALIVSLLIVVQAPNAEAAPVVSRHNGIVVTTPRHLPAWNGRRAVVKPTISVKRGARRQLLGHVTMAFQNGQRVAHGRTLRLSPGSYRIAVRVRYRGWHLVTRSRLVKVWHYPGDGGPWNTNCTVLSLDQDGLPKYIRCTSASYPGQSLDMAFSSATSCPDWPANDTFTVGQVLHHNTCADFKPYYTTETQRYRARAYSKVYWFTTARHQLVVVARHSSAAAPVTHSCTLTSTGHCIQGGEFCPQADYGMTGYDANGTAYICEGNATHPHWE